MTEQVTHNPTNEPPYPGLHHSTNEQQLEQDVAVLRALSSETRYSALRAITLADEEICVCDIEAALDVSQGAVSQALSTLTDAGLVSRRKDGRWRYYQATEKAQAILTVLDETRGDTND